LIRDIEKMPYQFGRPISKGFDILVIYSAFIDDTIFALKEFSSGKIEILRNVP